MRRTLALLALGAIAMAAPHPGQPDSRAAASPPKAAKPAGPARVIEMHAGIPGVVYLGQPLEELLEKLPGAQVARDANRPNAARVQHAGAGISCLLVGSSGEDLKVASLRFELDHEYDALIPHGYRTDKGIGAGSTVNDVVVAYGKPSAIFKGSGRPTPGSGRDSDVPEEYEKYQYASDDNAYSTYFLIEGSAVRAVVLNDKDPLRQQITPRQGE